MLSGDISGEAFQKRFGQSKESYEADTLAGWVTHDPTVLPCACNQYDSIPQIALAVAVPEVPGGPRRNGAGQLVNENGWPIISAPTSVQCGRYWCTIRKRDEEWFWTYCGQKVRRDSVSGTGGDSNSIGEPRMRGMGCQHCWDANPSNPPRHHTPCGCVIDNIPMETEKAAVQEKADATTNTE